MNHFVLESEESGSSGGQGRCQAKAKGGLSWPGPSERRRIVVSFSISGIFLPYFFTFDTLPTAYLYFSTFDTLHTGTFNTLPTGTASDRESGLSPWP